MMHGPGVAGFVVIACALGLACAESSTEPCEGRFVAIYDGQGSTADKILYPGDVMPLSGTLQAQDPMRGIDGCWSFLYSSSTYPERFTWESSDTTVARISATGQVTAVALGTTTVRSHTQGLTDEVSVRVVPRVFMIRITATPTQPRTGDTVTVSIVGLDTAGDVVPNAVLDLPTWRSGNIPRNWVTRSPAGGRFVVVAPGPLEVWSSAPRSIQPVSRAFATLNALPAPP